MITNAETPAVPVFAARHYSIPELAQLWNVSDDFIRRLFEKESGVLIFADRHKGSRRIKRTFRIPSYVVERVHRQRST